MIEEIIGAIQAGDANGVLIKPLAEGVLTGFSGEKLFGTLQRLAAIFSQVPDTCYVEVGVFQGLTLLSTAISALDLPCYGIDNFAYLDPDNKNFDIVNQRTDRLNIKNTTIINRDYEDALENLHEYIGDKKIGVYFIDGPHDYRSQLMCLQLSMPYLHPNAVIIIDDSNYRHVRQANRDFLITHPEYKLVFESYTPCHPQNMTPTQETEARQGWWDGVNILVRDPGNELQLMYPPTERSRELYENEHLLHASNLAKYSLPALSLVQALHDGKFATFVARAAKIVKLFQSSNPEDKPQFRAMNTYSEELPKTNFSHLSAKAAVGS